MQLVPILSTIILIGTIATFILAVAAYILYKIRERRAREEGVVQTQFVQEPHVLVAPQQTSLAVPVQQAPTTNVFVAPGVTTPHAAPAPATASQAPVAQDSLFWEYTDEGFVPVQPDDSAREADTQEQQDDEGFAWL
jgi:heme/copper-type cytochrome/quinol oxidase subunit 2